MFSASKATTRLSRVTTSSWMLSLSTKIDRMRRLIFFFLSCAISASLVAHDSPEHQVELLSSIIASQGKSASLLVKRAIEYRALGQLEKAVRDLQEALQIKP